jgi:hypothetical protein
LAEAKDVKKTTKYVLDEEVEALWEEDGEWYLARILDIKHNTPPTASYRVIFTEYGNEQDTVEENIRRTLKGMFDKAETDLSEAAKEEQRKQAEIKAAFMKREQALAAGNFARQNEMLYGKCLVVLT